MAALGVALDVSSGPELRILANLLTERFFFLEDFALTEAAYTVVRLLRQFPVIRLPMGQKVELTGVEKQTMTLVISSTEGCMVEMATREK